MTQKKKMSAAFSWLPKHEEPAVAEVEDQLVRNGAWLWLSRQGLVFE